jgi:hypothetical protein
MMVSHGENELYTNHSVFHLEVGGRCLQSMEASLKKHICGLPGYVMNADAEDLDKRREGCIGGGLEYACKSRAKHLLLGSQGQTKTSDTSSSC